MYTQLAQKRYVSTQISTADRLKLVVMLYEGAISFLKQAKEKMAAKDAAGKGLFINKTLDIIAELNASLNFKAGGEVAANLSRIYNFMSGYLTRANINWEPQAVDEVIEMLSRLKEAWIEVNIKVKNCEAQGLDQEVDLTPRRHLGSIIV
ncbi:MAG: flagellar export chaperone FliS [Desulfobacca sp. 4484_104]|nr:MAG: flagellar export chaperone FliS [Desulfobacca sp. 4484_104]